MNSPDIYQKIDEAYQNNHQRLIDFFQEEKKDGKKMEGRTFSGRTSKDYRAITEGKWLN